MNVLELGCFLTSGSTFLRPFIILFCLGKKRLEAMVNLAKFPENRNQQNRDDEQKELGSHLLAFRARN